MAISKTNKGLESYNTRYYPIYRSLVSMMAWLPIFFMYFNQGLTFKEVILLESIYYFSVVLFEVPSGYFSDVVGRKTTLIISSTAFGLSYLMFGIFSPAFMVFAAAQVLLAVGFSFLSGTCTAFYYESLNDAGLSEEFAEREARVQSYQRYAGALAALIGGVLGSIHLSYGYLVSMIFMIPAVLITLRFSEPAKDASKKVALPVSQLSSVARYLKTKELRWLFLYSIVLYVLIHVPYEFYQPYLKLLEDSSYSIPLDAALYSGLLFAGTRFFGAIVAGQSIRLTKLFGLRLLCIVSIMLQLAIIGIFGYVLHSLVILLILFRSVSLSMTIAPVNAEIAPRVDQAHRATYFSFQSLLSRLSFSLTLIVLSFPVASEIFNDWETVSMIFRYSFYGGALMILPLLFLGSGALFAKDR